MKWRRIFDVYYMATSEADLEKKKREIEGCSVELFEATEQLLGQKNTRF